MLGNLRLKSVLVRTHHFIDFHAPLVEVERGHGLNPAGGSHIIGIVDVHFDKYGFRRLFRELFEDWSNELARTTPAKTQRKVNQTLENKGILIQGIGTKCWGTSSQRARLITYHDAVKSITTSLSLFCSRRVLNSSLFLINFILQLVSGREKGNTR